ARLFNTPPTNYITARKKPPASQHAGNAFAMPNATPWSVEEDVRLCKAYTNISEDARSHRHRR
ncbi:hypothetical protein PF001_g29778, partial [Phytophthora fragariae]